MSLPEKHYSCTCISRDIVKKLLAQVNEHSMAINYEIERMRDQGYVYSLNTGLPEITAQNSSLQELLVSFHDLYLS